MNSSGTATSRPPGAAELSIAPGFRAALLAIALLICSGCGSGAQPVATPIDVDRLPAELSQTATTTATPSATGAVTIVDFLFSPAMVRIPRGATVTWTNKGSSAHRVVADSGVFDEGQVAPDASVRLTFGQAGFYAYHCAIHPAMHGTITVG